MIDSPGDKLSQFQCMAMQVVGHKIYIEYITVINEYGPTEPEHFVEEWIVKNRLILTPSLESKIMRYFLSYLVEHANQEGTE